MQIARIASCLLTAFVLTTSACSGPGDEHTILADGAVDATGGGSADTGPADTGRDAGAPDSGPQCDPTAPELCNGIDDNCNGMIDDNPIANDLGNCGECGRSCGDGLACSEGQCVGVTGLVAGRDFACALHSTEGSGEVYCWGGNATGQLGRGATFTTSMAAADRVLIGGEVLGEVTLVAASAAASHSCAIRLDGTVVCWGDNDDGQCGSAASNPAAEATAVPGITNAVQVATGSGHSCAVDATGHVFCWGANTSGQLGAGSTLPVTSSTPLAMVEDDGAGGLSEIDDAIAVVAGRFHTCVLSRAGTRVSCAGSNSAGGGWTGVLGRGSAASAVAYPITADVDLPEDVVAQAIATGTGFYASHTCVLTYAGVPICWGTNTYSQIAPTSGGIPTPHALDPYYTGAYAMALGGDFTCLAYQNEQYGKRVACQGQDSGGQLGDGALATSPIADDVRNESGDAMLGRVLALAAGNAFVCALLPTGRVTCWGDNSASQFGVAGPSRPHSDPIAVVPGLPSTEGCNLVGTYFADGDRDGFGDKYAETIRACTAPAGYILDGRDCNDGDPDLHPGATETCDEVDQDCDGLIDEGATDSDAACGACGVVCEDGQTCSDSACVSLQQIAAGSGHACALYSNGAVYCWGDNTAAQLGQATQGSNAQPQRVRLFTDAPLGDVESIGTSAAARHTCAARSDGTVVCWGNNDNGQLGPNAPTTYAARAYPVTGLSDVVSVAAGTSHSCAVQTGGTLVCWGDNSVGQLGIGTTSPSQSSSPLAMVEDDGAGGMREVDDAVEVVAGRLHSCFVHRGGERVSCVGNDSAGGGWTGVLGRGTVSGNIFATADDAILPEGTIVTKLASGMGFYSSHTCVLTATGAPVCWGTNTYRQIAASGGSIATPLAMSAFPSASGVALGSDFTCFVYEGADGQRVGCQGSNNSGQLGNATTASSDSTPSDVFASSDGSSYLSGVTDLIAGRAFVCAQLTGGALTCWGDNSAEVYGTSAASRGYVDISATVPVLD